MQRSHVSAVPVLDTYWVAGVVSEANLVRRLTGPAPRGNDRAGMAPAATVQNHRVTAAELTTAPAVTTNSGADVADTARLMQARQVKRLPVVDEDGRLAGIVSRADVLSVFERADAKIRD